MRHRVQPAEPFVPAAQVLFGGVPGGERVAPAQHRLGRGVAGRHVALDDLAQDEGRESPRLDLRVLQAPRHLVAERDEISVFGPAADTVHHREVGNLVTLRRIGRTQHRQQVIP